MLVDDFSAEGGLRDQPMLMWKFEDWSIVGVGVGLTKGGFLGGSLGLGCWLLVVKPCVGIEDCDSGCV